MMSSWRIGEVIGFLLLLSKILEEIGRCMKRRSGRGDWKEKKMQIPGMERGGKLSVFLWKSLTGKNLLPALYETLVR